MNKTLLATAARGGVRFKLRQRRGLLGRVYPRAQFPSARRDYMSAVPRLRPATPFVPVCRNFATPDHPQDCALPTLSCVPRFPS